MLNATMRWLALELHPFQTQFLRYLCGAMVMLPLILRSGFASYRPNHWPGQLWRGALHTLGLSLWFYDRPEVIVVWQSITVTLFSFPMAWFVWKHPTGIQWFWFLVCGALGSAAHYCLTRSFEVSDISSTQSVKFLDLVWASLLGWLMFSDIPARATLIGALVILGSTIWLARRESRRRLEGR
ncbi:MAG: DMT family transporter [Betaproteobacteria bacterium]|nr:DMT family transporter [Betaproteobacteria bacterium]